MSLKAMISIDDAIAYAKSIRDEHRSADHLDAEEMYQTILRVLISGKRLSNAAGEYISDASPDNLDYLKIKHQVFIRAARGDSPYGKEE